MRARRFPGAEASVGHARQFTADALSAWPAAKRDVALLMVSELATNALQHADSAFSVAIDGDRGAVRVEVSDSGDGVPALRSPAALDPSGRGLRLVDSLASEWGVRWNDPPGKTVWFRLSC